MKARASGVVDGADAEVGVVEVGVDKVATFDSAARAAGSCWEVAAPEQAARLNAAPATTVPNAQCLGFERIMVPPGVA